MSIFHHGYNLEDANHEKARGVGFIAPNGLKDVLPKKYINGGLLTIKMKG